MKKFSSVVFTFFVLLAGLVAQKDDTLFGESGLRLTGVWGGPMYGMALYPSESPALRGSQIGLEFNRMLTLGVKTERMTRGIALDEAIPERFKMKQKGFFLAFSPLSNRVVHPRVAFSMASGEVKSETIKDDIFVVQPRAGLEVNVFKWCRLGLEGGYNFVSRSDIAGIEDEEFSTFFVDFQLRFGFSWGD